MHLSMSWKIIGKLIKFHNVLVEAHKEAQPWASTSAKTSEYKASPNTSSNAYKAQNVVVNLAL